MAGCAALLCSVLRLVFHLFPLASVRSDSQTSLSSVKLPASLPRGEPCAKMYCIVCIVFKQEAHSLLKMHLYSRVPLTSMHAHQCMQAPCMYECLCRTRPAHAHAHSCHVRVLMDKYQACDAHRYGREFAREASADAPTCLKWSVNSNLVNCLTVGDGGFV